MNYLSLGKKIQFFRKRVGYSQFDLELKIKSASGSISRIENGKVNPSKETLCKIGEVLNLSIDEIGPLFGLNVVDINKLSLNKIYYSLSFQDVSQSIVDFIPGLEERDGFITAIMYYYNEKKEAFYFLNKSQKSFKANNVIRELYPPNHVEQRILSVHEFTKLSSIYEKKVFQIGISIRDIIGNQIPRGLERRFCERLNLHSTLGFPIIIDDKVKYFLHISSQLDINKVANKIDTLKTYVQHSSLALSNSLQFEKLKKENKRLKSLIND